MYQHDRCNWCGLAVLSDNAQIRTALSMRVVVDVQNELLPEFHYLNLLFNLHTFLDQAKC